MMRTTKSRAVARIRQERIDQRRRDFAARRAAREQLASDVADLRDACVIDLCGLVERVNESTRQTRAMLSTYRSDRMRLKVEQGRFLAETRARIRNETNEILLSDFGY